ncbi:uncharacterized protein GGS22DRAFT_71835 [Annulohypoxylon maeteangense]|uniref:uncharacterized protein n=1 Tax=Annulohypoxylon maeteangense TaxID=1927788 RepID=UPI0020082A40|nr:uncharacterized protein GGS22DRAFT_71835 [Annulohypoxylon maeteangense]KAI0881196.1 hypothetical protein GGS22DRAFT_71835 [Annulohypoxylon maeteangense]
MYSLLSLVLVCSSLVIAKPIGDVSEFQSIADRDVELLPRFGPHTRGVMVRRDANKTFDLGFEVNDLTLFTGSWPVAKGTTVSLDLSCVECRTYGELNAFMEFPDNIEDILKDLKDFNPFNDASLTVEFQGAGALIDLSVATRGTGHFTIPLFKSQTPLGISGPGFQAGITFNVDLIVGVTAEIETKGGFEVTIPDGSSFTINLDDKVDNNAKFSGTSATLLPLRVDAPATITVALRLAVQGGIELPKIPLVDAKAIAGAYINIPQVTLGEQFSMPPANGSNCILPATAEVNINAGAYVDIGVDIADITIGDYDPTVSTTFFKAATSTCFITASTATSTPLITGTGSVTATRTGTGATGTTATAAATTTTAPACVSPSTSKKTTTSTYTVTSCAAAVVNCPNSLTQVIVVTDILTQTSTSCAGSSATGAALANAPFANATLVSSAEYLTLTSLSAPVTSTLSIPASVVTPKTTLITGSAGVAAVTSSASASVEASVVEGGAKGRATTLSSVTVSTTRAPCSKKATATSVSVSSSSTA